MNNRYWILHLGTVFIFLGCNFGVFTGIFTTGTVDPGRSLDIQLVKPILTEVKPGTPESKPGLPTRNGPARSNQPSLDGSKISPTLEPGALWITNPNSNARLYVKITRPVNFRSSEKYPVLVIIPGGIADSSGFSGPKSESEMVAAAGIITVVFDADGRGGSSGSEDFDGFVHQDGLAEIIRKMAAMPEVHVQQIALTSCSHGVDVDIFSNHRKIGKMVKWANVCKTKSCQTSKEAPVTLAEYISGFGACTPGGRFVDRSINGGRRNFYGFRRSSGNGGGGFFSVEPGMDQFIAKKVAFIGGVGAAGSGARAADDG